MPHSRWNARLYLGFTFILLISSPVRADFGDHSGARFRVSVQNVTAANGISPFLGVVGSSQFSLFELGMPASKGIATVAETGNTALLEEELMEMNESEVRSVQKAEGGPIGPGEKRSIEFHLRRSQIHGATLHLVAMIGLSNDSFIAVRGFPLSQLKRGDQISFNAMNYDAGSEENTGNREDFGMGGHPVEKAEGRVSIDRGLNPAGNADHLIAWGAVAARVTLERIR